jgi:hypothetical protein
MARYKIITFVDITRTNPSRQETNKLKLGQQANFNCLIQAIGLRANVAWEQDPELNTGRLPHPMVGKANHWIWEFETERDYLFLKELFFYHVNIIINVIQLFDLLTVEFKNMCYLNDFN